MRLIDELKQIKESAGYGRYLNNTSWLLAGKAVTLLLSFISTAIVARVLGPTNLGEISYALSFIAIFSFIASGGLDLVLYRNLIKHPSEANVLLGSAYILRIKLAVFATTLVIISAFIFSPNDVSLYLILILSLTFIFQSTFIINTEFGAALKSKPITLLSLLIISVLSVIKISVVLLGGGVIYLAFVFLLESILYAIGYVILRQRYFGEIKLWINDKQTQKQLISDAWPYFLLAGFSIIYARIDQVMLKNLEDSQAVGLYDTAVRLTELWVFIPATIVSSLFPALVKSRHDSHVYKKRFLLLTLLIISITLVISTTIYHYADKIIHLIYGSDFYDAVQILRIYIWSLVSIGLITILQHIILNDNLKIPIIIAPLSGAICNIILNVILIEKMGPIGAAYASLVSYAIILTIILGYLTHIKLSKKWQKK